MQELIQPHQSGQVLLDDISQTHPKPGQLAMWWLGQSGYVFKTFSQAWYIDLYLSEHLTQKYANTPKPHQRMTLAPLRGNDLQDVRWVFASHKHSDHLDPATLPDLFQNNPQAELILPFALVDHAKNLGLTRLIPTKGDETLHLGALTVHVIPSAHPDLDFDPLTGYPFLGFVFQVDGLNIYHSGDTLVYDGLAERLQGFGLDIACLPINGTDERRQNLGVPPNMNIQEAISLAQQIQAHLLIPHHYDMFTFNTVEIADFIAAAEHQPHRVLQCGEKFIYTKD